MTSQAKRQYSDLKVGEVRQSPALTVTEAHIVGYAGLTGDVHPIHMNADYAKASQFGDRLAQGPLVFGIGMGMLLQADPLDTIAFLGMDWKIVGPVKIGDTIHLRTTVHDMRVTSSGDRAIVTHHCEIVNQSGQVVQKGLTKVIMAVA